jgi:hypothetical protein
VQTCLGDDGCATRFCDPVTRKCGCPASGPLQSVPNAAGTGCERIISREVVAAAACGRAGCRCPEGAKPAADGVGCVIEKRQAVLLPAPAASDSCFNDKQDDDESDVDCGEGCSRRCGSGQRCKRSADCTSGLKCVETIMTRGANGLVTKQGRCACPSGRYMAFKGTVASCVRAQELCSNGRLDPAHEVDTDW